jgi:MFS family permease
MQFLFSPFWGWISDRVGRRPVLLISILGTALSLTFTGFAHSLLWLFVGRALAGFCGANISTAMAYMADITDEKNRAKGMGIIGAAFGLGFIFGPAIGGILSRHGFHMPFLVAGVLSFTNFLFAVLALKEPQGSVESRAKNRTRRFDPNAIKRVLQSSVTRRAVFLFFMVTFAFTHMEVIFALFVKTHFGMGAESAGWLLAMVGIIMTVIQGGGIGKLSKKFGETKLIITGTALMSVGLFFSASATTLGIFAFSMVLVAMGNGINSPSLSSTASKGASVDNRGATMGVYQSAGSLARVLGPPVAGFLFDHAGTHAPFVLAAILMALCSVYSLFVLKKP